MLDGRPFDFTGQSVGAAGDVNGDGIDDVILAGPGGGDGFSGAYVVFGRNTAQTGNFPAIFSLQNLLLAQGGDGGDGFVLVGAPDEGAGSEVNAAGDVNGDGVADVIIGGGFDNAGAGYVVFGTTEGFPAEFEVASLRPSGGGDGSRGFVLPGINAGDRAGTSVDGAGDVDGDGIDDLVIGSDGAPKSHSTAGQTYVVFGRSASP